MDTSLSMLIMGSVLIIIGIVKNLIPVKFNESIFGKIEGKAENYAAAMRTNIGALFMKKENKFDSEKDVVYTN